MAIFMFVFFLFIGAQVLVLLTHVRSLTPSLASMPWMKMLEDDGFAARWKELSTNGDSIATVSLGADAIGLVALLAMCFWWKRERMVGFLGLRPPAFKPFLAWCGLFLGVFAVLEIIGQFLPNPEADFMSKVLGSITNYPLFFLGSCLMPALFEELLFRGLLLGSIRAVLDKNAAIAITAGIFTFCHLQYEWYQLLFNLLPLAVFLGYSRTNTGSIWTGVFLHFVNNAASVLLPMLFAASTN